MKNIILLRFHEHKNAKLNQVTSISKGAIFRVLHMTRSYAVGAVMVSRDEPAAAPVDLNQRSCA